MTVTTPTEEQTMPVMHTLTGRSFQFNDIRGLDPTLEELAMVLTRIPSSLHQVAHSAYSIAHHSLWVMRYLLLSTGCPTTAMHGLLYRAHSAYLGFVSEEAKTLEYLGPPLEFVTSQIQKSIYKSLDLTPPDEQIQGCIERASVIARAIEAEKFSSKRTHSHLIEKIPEVARMVTWDHSPSISAYMHFLEAARELMEAMQDEETLQ